MSKLRRFLDNPQLTSSQNETANALSMGNWAMVGEQNRADHGETLVICTLAYINTSYARTDCRNPGLLVMDRAGSLANHQRWDDQRNHLVCTAPMQYNGKFYVVGRRSNFSSTCHEHETTVVGIGVTKSVTYNPTCERWIRAISRSKASVWTGSRFSCIKTSIIEAKHRNSGKTPAS